MTTINLPRAIVQQALEALYATERFAGHGAYPADEVSSAITALRPALAQQAEPEEYNIADEMLKMLEEVSLTDPVFADKIIYKIDAALPALRAALAQQAKGGGNLPPPLQAEPVEEPAYKVKVTGRWHDAEPLPPAFSLPDGEHLLYTAPPQRPTEAVQEPVAWSGYDLDGMVEAFSRVIEAHYQRANPFQNPIDMDAQMALRVLRGFIPAMKAYTAPPQQVAQQAEPVARECSDPMCACRGGPCAECEEGEREKEIEDLRSSLYFYQRRCEALQSWQSKMRDPERTIVCDILANGKTLDPAVAGNRYTTPQQAEPVEPVAHCVVAGALFDFMGWLTSRRERLVLSSTDDAAPAVDAIKDFAEMRGLSLDDAKVQDWDAAPHQRKPLPKHDQHCVDVPGYGLTAVRLVRAVELAHGIK